MQNTKKADMNNKTSADKLMQSEAEAIDSAISDTEESEAAMFPAASRTVAGVRRIARHETTQRSAEIYQNRLYGRFNYVRLVDWPRFSGTGTFIWEVAKPINP